MTSEKIEKRFGVFAVEMGFITADQLVEALKIQVTEDLRGDKRRLIGTILLDQGHMTNQQVDDVVLKLMKQ